MKKLLLSIVVAAIGGGFGFCQDAEKVPQKAVSIEKISTADSKPPSSTETLGSLKQTGLAFDLIPTSDIVLPDLIVSTNVPLEVVPTNRLTTIQMERVEIRGTLTPAIKKRTFGSVLQLFNPFAPAEYGGTGEPGGRNSFDSITIGPSTVLIGVNFKPKPADTEK